MEKQSQNRSYAVVTGASSGIGHALAVALAARGYNLIVVARRLEKLEQLKQRLEPSVTVRCIQADITKEADMKSLRTSLENFAYPISVLVNNAGVGDFGHFSDSMLEKQTAIIDLNIRALVQLSHICIPLLEKNKKSYILNVGSVAGFMPGPFMACYYATKSFVLSFTQALDSELRSRRSSLRVAVLCPGPTQSEFGDVAGFSLDGKSFLEKQFAKYTSSLPSAEKVAEYGLKKLFANKRIIIHGFQFRLIIFLIRFLPRSLVVEITRAIQNKRM